MKTVGHVTDEQHKQKKKIVIKVLSDLSTIQIVILVFCLFNTEPNFDGSLISV